jgi:serine/threonine protein kinase
MLWTAVIFRDLKPENLGFDLTGTIKIFDFGVARDLAYVRRVNDRLGLSGTPRYMANEVMIKDDYDLPADVYSFGILLYEICTLKRPFPRIKTVHGFRNKVAIGGERPNTSIMKNVSLRSMSENCWSPIPDFRPSFADIRAELESIIKEPKIQKMNEHYFNGATLTFRQKSQHHVRLLKPKNETSNSHRSFLSLSASRG